MTEQLCVNQNSTDPMTRVPVYDHVTALSFANVFCAVCNDAKNYSYWHVRLGFNSTNILSKSRNLTLSNALSYAQSWTTEPYPFGSETYCVPSPTPESTPEVFGNTTNNTILWSFCKSYSMPVTNGCKDSQNYKKPTLWPTAQRSISQIRMQNA